MSEPYSIETFRAGIHRKGTAARLGWTSLIAFVALCPLAMGLNTAFSMWAAVLLPLLLGLASLIALVAPRRGGLVTFDPDGMQLPRGRRIPRSRLLGGWVVPSRRGRRVELQLGGGDAIVIDVADVAEGERVLAAAGVAASQRRLVVRTGTGLDTAITLFYGAMLGGAAGFFTCSLLRSMFTVTLPGWMASVLVSGSAIAWPLALLAFRAATRVVVGADGLTLYNGPFGRFVPYTSIASIAPSPLSINVLRIALRGNRHVDLSVSGLSLEERAALGARIQAAMADASRGGTGPSLELLDRGARPVSAWRDALRELGSLAGGYRAQAITREDLLRVLEDASAAAERRLGAALALAARRDDAAALERVRVASQTCASEPLRVALAATAEGDLDETALERAVGAAGRTSVRVRT